jgi:hypothetical protein
MTRNFRSVTVALLLAVCALVNLRAQSVPPSSAREGIKVHGDWTIEIRNPDGQLVERRQFKNALVRNGTPLSGDALLITALIGFNKRFHPSYSNTWRITLLLGTTKLTIEENGHDPASDTNSTNLLYSSTGSGSLIFAGTIRAPVAGMVTKVSTGNVEYENNPRYEVEMPFTETDCCPPGGPISVGSGQLLDVKVVISFS